MSEYVHDVPCWCGKRPTVLRLLRIEDGDALDGPEYVCEEHDVTEDPPQG